MNEAWATHTVCIGCYLDLNPDVLAIVVASLIRDPVVCCHCGDTAWTAVMMRAAVADMPHCTMPELGMEAPEEGSRNA